MTTPEAARTYIKHGLAVVRIPPRTKAPVEDEWQNISYAPDNFAERDNIGIKLGSKSKGTVDVDLDSAEALALADHFLPETGLKHGRQSMPLSHRWYECADGTCPARTRQFRDVNGSMLVELRSTGGQTLVPPSIHPSGEPLIWNGKRTACVDGQALDSAVSRLAAAALLVRHYPAKGSRHDLSLALSGMLLRRGWTNQDARRFIGAIAAAARDEEVIDRLAAVDSTAKTLDTSGRATGVPTLEVIVEKKVARKLADWLFGGSANVLAERLSAEHTAGITIPEIEITGRYRHEITSDSLQALKDANQASPFVFRRGSEIVRLQPGHGHAERLTPAALGGILDRTARYMRSSGSGDNSVLSPARPPNDVVTDLLSLPDLDLPELLDIRNAPVFLPDGRLLTAPGYDDQSRIYLVRTRLDSVRADIPVDEALKLILDELLGDFPFADDSSKAHTLALILLPFVRPMIAGATPLHLIDAPARGTGKGLLTDIVSEIALGEPAQVMALPRDSDEVEKRITAMLVTATPMVLLDNVRRLDATSLAAVLTTISWRGRLLGLSKMVETPNLALWVATGNNVELSDELVRRVVPIRLDAGVERPEERTGWRHPNLIHWTRTNRCKLVSACLSIVREWIDADSPLGSGTLGRFEDWAGVMGGILGVSGLSGFLGGRERLHAQADHETQDWIAFCSAWWEGFADLPVTAKDLFEVAKSRTLLLNLWGGRSALGAAQRFGHALQDRRDRVFGGHRIRTAGRDAHTGNNAYRLERQGSKTPETPDTTQGEHDARQCLPVNEYENTDRTAQNTAEQQAYEPVSPAFRAFPREAGTDGTDPEIML